MHVLDQAGDDPFKGDENFWDDFGCLDKVCSPNVQQFNGESHAQNNENSFPEIESSAVASVRA